MSESNKYERKMERYTKLIFTAIGMSFVITIAGKTVFPDAFILLLIPLTILIYVFFASAFTLQDLVLEEDDKEVDK